MAPAEGPRIDVEDVDDPRTGRAGGQLLTQPSDATGERPVGDAILLER
jgi:hypothetical protein